MHGEEKEFAVSSDPRSAPKTAKKPFFLSRWLLSPGRGSQVDTKFILVDTSWHWVDTNLIVTWYWTVLLLCPAGGGCWLWHSGWDTMYYCYNYLRQYHIISTKNTNACSIGPFYWALELGAEWQTQYAWTPQRIYTASPWHHSTVTGLYHQQSGERIYMQNMPIYKLMHILHIVCIFFAYFCYILSIFFAYLMHIICLCAMLKSM